jgi:hypothetical protein
MKFTLKDLLSLPVFQGSSFTHTHAFIHETPVLPCATAWRRKVVLYPDFHSEGRLLGPWTLRMSMFLSLHAFAIPLPKDQLPSLSVQFSVRWQRNPAVLGVFSFRISEQRWSLSFHLAGVHSFFLWFSFIPLFRPRPLLASFPEVRCGAITTRSRGSGVVDSTSVCLAWLPHAF